MDSQTPARRRIVVDGSNLATEGRTLPSLAQLNEAIETFLEEYRGFLAEDVTVVVDASFGHRIDPSEVSGFEDAIEHGEMVTPPAGAVGRGDGFILRIAEKSGALVLSNDSFQEFHAERPWLFEPGRLIGGKPVPGVGWVFTPRTPVRGPRSRSVTAKSRRDAKAIDDGDLTDELVETGDGEVAEVDGAPKAKRSRRRRGSRGSGSSSDTTRSTDRDQGDADDETDETDETDEPVVARSADTVDADDAYEDVRGRRTTAAKGTTKKRAATSTAQAAKAAPATKAAKATKATKAAKATSKAAKATKAATATKATRAVGKAAATATKAGAAPTKAAKATKATKATKAAKAPTRTKATPATGRARATAATGASKGTDQATGTKAPRGPAAGSPPGGGRPAGDALNDAMTFITFVAEHPIGSSFEGEVVSFTSHGAHVEVAGMVCHVPLRNLGKPAPQKARSVLTKGEIRAFELVSLDASHRRAELALPGLGG